MGKLAATDRPCLRSLSHSFTLDLIPTVDEAGASVERPCVQCGLLAAPDGPDPCLGMLPDVKAACCGHGVEEPYVLVGHGTVRGQQALDYFAHYGVGPRREDDTA